MCITKAYYSSYSLEKNQFLIYISVTNSQYLPKRTTNSIDFTTILNNYLIPERVSTNAYTILIFTVLRVRDEPVKYRTKTSSDNSLLTIWYTTKWKHHILSTNDHKKKRIHKIIRWPWITLNAINTQTLQPLGILISLFALWLHNPVARWKCPINLKCCN